jgi:hypothetical protein
MRKVDQEIAKAERRIERETRHAEEEARRAHERATRAVRRAHKRIARKSRKWGVPMQAGPPLFGPSPPSRAPRVSSEDQLSVLRMLQAGTITVEEAETLLKALES